MNINGITTPIQTSVEKYVLFRPVETAIVQDPIETAILSSPPETAITKIRGINVDIKV